MSDQGKLVALRAACWVARLKDAPRGHKRWWRLTLWLLEERYSVAKRIGGYDLAKTYDYIPF